MNMLCHKYLLPLSIIAAGYASDASSVTTLPSVKQLLQQEIAKQFSGARIEISGQLHWLQGDPQELIQSSWQSSWQSSGVTPSLHLMSENHGDIRFTVGSGGDFEGTAHFSAWIPAKIAKKRIFPGEKLDSDMFVTQEIDIATGQAYEYRGVLYPSNASISGLETRQTILEGQFLVSSAIKRIPDIRRGDPVRIRLVSGELTLSVPGTSEESGYLHNQLKVMSNKTKRVLEGQLLSDGIVEVKL